MPPLGQYSKLELKHSLEFLKAFHGMLEFEEVSTREQMFDVLQAAFKNQYLNVAKFAGDLGFSPSSVYRWIDGRGLPHKAVWRMVVDWIKSELETVIAEKRALRKAESAASVDA